MRYVHMHTRVHTPGVFMFVLQNTNSPKKGMHDMQTESEPDGYTKKIEHIERARARINGDTATGNGSRIDGSDPHEGPPYGIGASPSYQARLSGVPERPYRVVRHLITTRHD